MSETFEPRTPWPFKLRVETVPISFRKWSRLCIERCPVNVTYSYSLAVLKMLNLIFFLLFKLSAAQYHERRFSSISFWAKETSCSLLCHATSDILFKYSWTRNGQALDGHNIKFMNNSVIITSLDDQDFGDYVCHATKTFGSPIHKITLSECREEENSRCCQCLMLWTSKKPLILYSSIWFRYVVFMDTLLRPQAA